MSSKQSRVYIGVPDAAAYLDVDEKTIRRLISDNKLPAYRLGNRVIKIKITDLEGVLAPVASVEHAKDVVRDWPEPTDEQLKSIAGLLRSGAPQDRKTVVQSRIAELDGGAHDVA